MKSLFLEFAIFVTISLASAFDDLTLFENNLKQRNLKTVVNNTEGKVNISNYYLDFVCSRNDITTRNVSELCASQMEIVCNNAGILAQMADAWSKFPYTGMQEATRQEWGAFDQCIAVEHQPVEGPRILGKHCTNGLALPLDLNLTDFYLLSYCIPDACSALDLARLINIDPIPEAIVTSLVNELYCSTKETNQTWDASSIIVATLFCFIFGLVVLSTAYEVFLHGRQIKNKSQLLTAFSVFTNGQKLAQMTHGNGTGDQIQIFHGIKVISMMWILAGHSAGVFSIIPVTNRDKMAEFETKRYSQYLASAHLAVDTFFFISGFLLAYQYFKSAAKKPVIVQLMSVPKMIIHRYLRITPVVLMFFLYSMYLSKYIGNGPIFTAVHGQMNNPCKEHWWAVFLYVQNYNNPNDLCWVHLWYLSADWQLFLLAPFVLIPMAWQFRRRFNTVMIAMVILNIFFLLLPLYTKLGLPDFDPNRLEYDTHSKLVTYFMGVMFGFYFRCQKPKPYFFRNGLNILIWIFSLLVLFGATTLLHEVTINHESNTTKSLCEVFIKPFWCLGLTFIIYSCTHGYGGIVTWLLTAGWMQVVSKLTFCMYILHLPVIMFWAATKRTRDYFSDFNLFFIWCGHFIITLIVSTIWTLMFESPLITIERFLLGGGRPRPDKEKENKTFAKEKPKEKITVIHKLPLENEDFKIVSP